MEKQGSGSRELQCVGRLEIARPNPAGFLCGAIPVSTNESFQEFTSSDLVPSSDTISAPRYQMIPTETDLNALPFLSSIPEKGLPVAGRQFRGNEDSSWQGGSVVSSIARKGQELAVCGMVDYGDEIDVIAPTDVLKQIFKIPYSKARLSVAVHRVGRTLILNSGPDTEEGEKLIQRQNCQPKCVDQSLFLNFAMHSVRMEACDCPPHRIIPSDEQISSPVYSHKYQPHEEHQMQGHGSYKQHDGITQGGGYRYDREFIQERENLYVGKNNNKGYKGREAIKKAPEVKEKPRCSMQESEKYVKVDEDGFLRVFFWQFHNFRMLLGSDLLVFSNEKYVAVSLHLWDVLRKVTPLTWLEAWLDNFMASVPELAICYHQGGVVQGYELLKADDIFLLKGISDDGTPAFHPRVVQQNGLAVMRFLQENCKQEPGAYWLYKSAGDDVLQLFDLSIIPKNRSSDGYHDSSGSLPSLIYRGKSDSMLSLGTLLYRIAHRLSLSLSQSAINRAKCARYFQKCLNLLEDPDHLVVRALAHEHFARLLLTFDEELELVPAVLPVEAEVTFSDPFEFMTGLSATTVQNMVCPFVITDEPTEDVGTQLDLRQENSPDLSFLHNIASPIVPELLGMHVANDDKLSVSDDDFIVSNVTKKTNAGVESPADPLASKLAAIHHVSQAIKSLRWTRQLQITRSEINLENESEDDVHSVDFLMCVCGVTDCIEVCDILEWLPTSKIDDKLLKLVLLLGESYLALGQAYKDDGQLCQALKTIELACLVYGSMPQDTRYISSIISNSEFNNRRECLESSSVYDYISTNGLSSKFIFWAKAWSLVGDVFVELYLKNDQDLTRQSNKNNCAEDLKMSSEVLREFRRLKKKLGQFNQNCSSCSLINCSCHSERATSGNSASSSGRDQRSSSYGRKQNKKGRNSYIHAGVDNNVFSLILEPQNIFGAANMDHLKSDTSIGACTLSEPVEKMYLAAANSKGYDGPKKTTNAGLTAGTPLDIALGEKTAAKGSGGIFKYLRNSVTGNTDCILSSALNCYEEAQKAMGALPPSSADQQSVLKKKGWVCNELGRYRLEMKDLVKAETAFLKAIDAFRHVGDHVNSILINCNLGHGRRALGEDMVADIEIFKKDAMFQNAYVQALEAAKLQYRQAIRYYAAAKSELNALVEVAVPVSSSLKNEVNTQFAHTYLKFGMLLSRENTIGVVYENGVLEYSSSSAPTYSWNENRKHEISANDAIREALSVYESLGELRRQEAAYAHYQLACYQRDCCLRFLELDQKKHTLAKGDSSASQKVKQYISLAERNWQKSIDFYGPKTHPVMYLTILIDRSALSLRLSSYLHSSSILESALSHLLEGRHVSEDTSLYNKNEEICAKFWSQLQMLLKIMLATTRSAKQNKYPDNRQQTPPIKTSDAKKLSELYKISLKSSDFSQLHWMHRLWKET